MNKKSIIIKNPRITEKASYSYENNVYVFNVSTSATKNDIKKEIFKIFKVQPIKVNIVNMPKKRTIFKGRKSLKGQGKKAYVYLKEGDKIDIS